MLHDLLVDDVIHHLEALNGLLLGDTDICVFQWHGTVAVVEEEQPFGWVDTQERSYIFVIGQCSRQTYQSHVLLCRLNIADCSENIKVIEKRILF